MSVHQLHPLPKHRLDEKAKDFTRMALLNIMDGVQQFSDVSHLLPDIDVQRIELALNTAMLFVIHSHPRVVRKRLERKLQAKPASNEAGGAV
ncbi:hypothetical protein PSCICJ_48130 [Pseudomonas cichorii]|uniref:hypothetical protein n=1 Tax=Pseudomonas cichorii TaxID=36746 RepID=UPI0019109D38|nr:hypothetical protein [Pseudomonas cichorii]GFM68695.1 hypothetical protein PSCICJ_48130 [Pseudomonas cichorii]